MKKFLLSWILIVTFVFFELPLSIQANAVSYYTYYFSEDFTFTATWDGSSSTIPVPRFSLGVTVKDVFSNTEVLDTDLLLFSFSNVALSRISSDSLVSDDALRSLYENQTSGSVRVYNTGFTSSLPFDYRTDPYNIRFPSSQLAPYPTNGLFYYNFSPVRTSSSFASSSMTLIYQFNVIAVVSTARRIDTSGTDTYLVSIDSDFNSLLSKQDQLISVLGSGFGKLNSDLLDILDVLNKIASSGGSGGTGTAAIVGAVNGATAAIGQVLSQQQASSSDIVGAVNSQTSSLNSSIQGQTDSLNSTLSLVDASISRITSTLEQDKQDNVNAATEKGNELTGMATQIKNTAETSWDALSFPIDFTNQVFQVFSGGTSSAAYTRAYGDVLGYRYNSDTGGLEPIYRRYRDGTPRVAGGTTITFPAFSLPVPGVGTLQLWDSYEFDLSVISGYLPVLFDALHLIIGILLIYWVIGYLIDLGHDIIG